MFGLSVLDVVDGCVVVDPDGAVVVPVGAAVVGVLDCCAGRRAAMGLVVIVRPGTPAAPPFVVVVPPGFVVVVALGFGVVVAPGFVVVVAPGFVVVVGGFNTPGGSCCCTRRNRSSAVFPMTFNAC